jgi:hypothetical protein
MVQSFRLLLTEEQGFYQDYDADANQDHGGNNHPIDIGFPDQFDYDCDTTEEG